MSMDDSSNRDQTPYEEYQDSFREDMSGDEGPKKGPNRTFLTILGIVGSIFVLAIIVLIAFVLISRNRSAERFQQQAATINAENTAIAEQASQTAAVLVQRMTEKAMPPTWTPTSVIAQATATTRPPTATVPGIADSAGRTATIAAFLTQVSQATSGPAGGPTSAATTAATKIATRTPTVTGTRATATPRRTSTALPTTGFADEVGLPGLFGLALALVVIIVLARRLRVSTIQ